MRILTHCQNRVKHFPPLRPSASEQASRRRLIREAKLRHNGLSSAALAEIARAMSERVCGEGADRA